MLSNLTTLANVKNWCGVSTTTDDALLTRLISSASRFILSYLNRPTLFQHVYNDVYDGMGQRSQTLRNFPVISVNSLTVMGQSIPASPAAPQSGYLLDSWDGLPPGRPQALSLYGYGFPQRAPQSVQVSYTAGFAIENEPQTVASSGFQVSVAAPLGSWGTDQGVTYANGTALTDIQSGTPAMGQYVPPTATNAFYQFAAADADAAVLISYSYIPADIEQACIEMVGERYSYKGRIGQISKSLGGQETMSFSQKNMPDFINSLLSPYRRVVMV